MNLVKALAADADLIVAVDGGGALCRRAGVTPHLVVGDLDSLPRATAQALEADGVEFRRFPAEKDDSDLALALAIAGERSATEVFVTAASTRRLDHTLAALAALCHTPELRPVLIEPHVEAFVLAPGAREELRVNRAGTTLSLMAFGGPARVSAEGVRWPLAEALLDPTSTRGLSNVVEAGREAVVRVHEGVVIAIVPMGPETR